MLPEYTCSLEYLLLLTLHLPSAIELPVPCTLTIKHETRFRDILVSKQGTLIHQQQGCRTLSTNPSSKYATHMVIAHRQTQRRETPRIVPSCLKGLKMESESGYRSEPYQNDKIHGQPALKFSTQ
ncbi:uncharacterized protein BP01DRAFT_143329 [Aspergillus saccharolyticus JOP 1030-1]|uniref:Secreted protein n=1 Tax=Aspergillus saccharolyticus JOP 1030-1 TaxID=1450539 RepID=A0A318ZPH4_9EURO|nr:hypothetical protein BP01DRAFT_143329 [Aspergillus saccharolyticus JOP 1030-1]PYH42018.1 hypothetical protein BP01DRAFT_143329 [Aspergillus saccharolyticus JOP 1030-1]